MYDQFGRGASLIVLQPSSSSLDMSKTIILPPWVEQSTKELLILLLSEIPGANCKQLYQIARKMMTKPISFQGIHKNLRILTEKEIVLKNKTKYYLNSDWVKETKNYYVGIEKKLSNPNDNILILR